MTEEVFQILEESRRREKDQTLFYRALAAVAEDQGDPEAAERLNALHADEQHHLARLSVRIMELDRTPTEAQAPPPPVPPLQDWEAAAREREAAEVAWYEKVLSAELDAETRALIREILESEGHHARELGGKWMSA